MNCSVVVLVLIAFSRLFAQGPSAVSEAKPRVQEKAVPLPKPVAAPAAGTWNYKVTLTQPSGAIVVGNYSVMVKEDGGTWTVTGHWPPSGMMPGEVIDVATLEKGTLLLRKESFRRFPKPGQPQKPITVDLDLSGNQVTGANTGASGEIEPVSIQLSAPVFAGGVAIDVILGCLPLAEGNAGVFPYWDIQQRKEGSLEFKVLGSERVTMATGALDTWKVELSAADRSETGTVWIAKESRVPLKSGGSRTVGSGTMFSSTELVP
jgi:hypothetical protein